MSKPKGIGNADGSPPTLEQFTAFVRRIAAVPKADVADKVGKAPARGKASKPKRRKG